jgi:uncharacterized membrane protein YjjP (DUF1212 family)
VQTKPENMVKLNLNGTFVNGFLDLITIWFLSRFEKTDAPFGAMGSLMFIIGFMLAVYIGISKYTTCIMICATVW